MHIVFYGPEGSGKGTQAKLLSEKLNLPVLVSGDLVRDAAVKDKGIIGDVCREALQTGKYVADTEMFVLWKIRLKEPDALSGWILDGFPRNIDQAIFLTDKIDKYGYKMDKVFYLKLNDNASLERLIKRGRKLHEGSNENHDSPERIRQRLEIYKSGEKDILNYFKTKGILEEIEGDRPIEEVHQDILFRLGIKI